MTASILLNFISEVCKFEPAIFSLAKLFEKTEGRRERFKPINSVERTLERKMIQRKTVKSSYNR